MGEKGSEGMGVVKKEETDDILKVVETFYGELGLAERLGAGRPAVGLAAVEWRRWRGGWRRSARWRWSDRRWFFWRDVAVGPWPRDDFTRGVIMGMLKLTPAEVYCLQNNVQERGFDVTLMTGAIATSVLAMCRARGQERPFCLYEVIEMDKQNLRVVTVTMFSPRVPEQSIAAFLGRYGSVVTAVRPVRDVFGFFDGRRQYQLLLGDDPEGVDGLSHPLARFAIGAVKGRLYYARQPPNCGRCQDVRHSDAACPGIRCRGCGARECSVPKTCHGSGSMCGGGAPRYRTPTRLQLGYTGTGVREVPRRV